MTLYLGLRSDAAAGRQRLMGRVWPDLHSDFVAAWNLLVLASKYTGSNGLRVLKLLFILWTTFDPWFPFTYITTYSPGNYHEIVYNPIVPFRKGQQINWNGHDKKLNKTSGRLLLVVCNSLLVSLILR